MLLTIYDSYLLKSFVLRLFVPKISYTTNQQTKIQRYEQTRTKSINECECIQLSHINDFTVQRANSACNQVKKSTHILLFVNKYCLSNGIQNTEQTRLADAYLGKTLQTLQIWHSSWSRMAQRFLPTQYLCLQLAMFSENLIMAPEASSTPIEWSKFPIAREKNSFYFSAICTFQVKINKTSFIYIWCSLICSGLILVLTIEQSTVLLPIAHYFGLLLFFLDISLCKKSIDIMLPNITEILKNGSLMRMDDSAVSEILALDML